MSGINMNFLKFSRKFARILIFPKKLQCGTRTLFTAETLGLTDYHTNRQNALNNVEGINNFKWELKCYLDNENELEAIRLKNAIEALAHLVDSDLDDVDLIKKTLYAIQSHKDVTDKTKRTIGNLVMKAIHSINLPDTAHQFYTDPNLQEFFAGFKSTLLCMDLLYINKKYDRILEIDSERRHKLWSSQNNFLKFIDVLVFASCYKMNTSQSFQYASTLWKNVGQTSQFKRSIAFVTALALNQGKPLVVIEILQNMDAYFVNEQIKLLAFVNSNLTLETIDALSMWTNDAKLSKHKISKDVIDKIRQHVIQKANTGEQERFQAIYDKIAASDLISNESLNEFLDRPFSTRIGIRGGKRREEIK